MENIVFSLTNAIAILVIMHACIHFRRKLPLPLKTQTHTQYIYDTETPPQNKTEKQNSSLVNSASLAERSVQDYITF